MKTIIVKFEVLDEILVGYENTCDELIVEDFLKGSEFIRSKIGWEILKRKNPCVDCEVYKKYCVCCINY